MSPSGLNSDTQVSISFRNKFSELILICNRAVAEVKWEEEDDDNDDDDDNDVRLVMFVCLSVEIFKFSDFQIISYVKLKEQHQGQQF